MKHIIVTGPKNSGKSSWCLQHYTHADGSIAIKTFANGAHTGYDAWRPCTGESVPLLRVKNDVTPCKAIEVGRFCMDRAGFVQSVGWIRNGTKSETLIIDEIGKFELDGNGYYDVVTHILSGSFPGNLVLVTRNIYVESVMLLFALPESSRIVDVTLRA